MLQSITPLPVSVPVLPLETQVTFAPSHLTRDVAVDPAKVQLNCVSEILTHVTMVPNLPFTQFTHLPTTSSIEIP